MNIIDMAREIERATKLNPLTPRWEATLRLFYGLELRPEDIDALVASTRRTRAALEELANAPTRSGFKELWARVGRRGRKSFTMALVALFECLYAGHEKYLVPGEQGLVAIISKDVGGATLVAKFLEIHAEALGLATNWTSLGNVSVLEIEGVPFGVACFACNAKAPRGYAIPVIIGDETAHWFTDSDRYVNTDENVFSAVKPAMAQFASPKLLAISSPLGRDGKHFEVIEANLGDDADPDVLAVEGPTHEWNPDITEARTHEIEKDPETHAREFGAVPSATEGLAFVTTHAEHSFRKPEGNFRWGKPSWAVDLSQWTNTLALVGFCWGEPDKTPRFRRLRPPPGSGLSPDMYVGLELDQWGRPIPEPTPTRPVLYVFRALGWDAEALRTTPMPRIMRDIANTVKGSGSDTLLADGYGARFAAALLSAHRVKMRAFAPTNTTINDAVGLLRTLMRDGDLILCDHDQLRKDVLTYPRTISGGTFKFGKKRGGKHHFDYASALVTMAH